MGSWGPNTRSTSSSTVWPSYRATLGVVDRPLGELDAGEAGYRPRIRHVHDGDPGARRVDVCPERRRVDLVPLDEVEVVAARPKLTEVVVAVDSARDAADERDPGAVLDAQLGASGPSPPAPIHDRPKSREAPRCGPLREEVGVGGVEAYDDEWMVRHGRSRGTW